MIKTLISILVCYTFSISIYAQSPDEKEVAGRVESLRRAMISADKAALENLTSEDLSYGHSSGKIEGKDSFVESIVTGGSRFMTIVLSDQTIKIVDKTALVRHKLVAETGTKEKPGTANLGVLLVWQKQKGEWKLIARHATKL